MGTSSSSKSKGSETPPSFTRAGITYTARRTFKAALSNFGVRRALRNASEVDGTFIVLEALFDDDALAALDDLDIDDPEMVEIMSAIFGDQDAPKDDADAVTVQEAQFPSVGD